MDELPEHRNLFCRHYDSCLDFAVRQGWLDWTCESCPLLAHTPRPSATSLARNQPRE
ncbi:MAG: hypothetical protein HYZ28_04725 [Myxococcales bacterium]|nr:hypothetical protein [Myxococcales bacterium]